MRVSGRFCFGRRKPRREGRAEEPWQLFSEDKLRGHSGAHGERPGGLRDEAPGLAGVC